MSILRCPCAYPFSDVMFALLKSLWIPRLAQAGVKFLQWVVTVSNHHHWETYGVFLKTFSKKCSYLAFSCLSCISTLDLN